MGGVGSDRRSARVVRDAHNRRLDPDNPDDLEAMAVSHHKALDRWPSPRQSAAGM